MSDSGRERYRNLRFLVIDDRSSAREGLRICAQTMGAFSVEFSSSYTEAIARVRRGAPDVILCDYNLGERRNGQHLLEEMRREALLPEESAFIMVTAEKTYENVVGTVELKPDDYIIKPFSPDRLRFRLDRALARKQFFRPLYVAKREQQFAAAGAFIERHLTSEEGKPFRFELMRVRAELLLERSDPLGAHAAYCAILELHPFPWARAGRARALLMLNRLQEARQQVDGVVADAPLYFEAFDLKARICMEMGDHEEARRTVEDASSRSVRNNARKRLLAEVALRSGDSEAAQRVMEEIVAGDVSGMPMLADRLMLVRSHLDAGSADAAGSALAAIAEPELEVASFNDKISYQALLVRLDPEAGRAAFRAHCVGLATVQFAVTTRVDVVQAALVLEDVELAAATAWTLFERGEIRPVFAQLRGIFAAHGQDTIFRDMQKRAALSRIGASGERTMETPSKG